MTDYIIHQGIGGKDGPWATYERKPNGSLKRILTKALPLRPTKAEAEHDLAAWLAKKGGPRER